MHLEEDHTDVTAKYKRYRRSVIEKFLADNAVPQYTESAASWQRVYQNCLDDPDCIQEAEMWRNNAEYAKRKLALVSDLNAFLNKTGIQVVDDAACADLKPPRFYDFHEFARDRIRKLETELETFIQISAPDDYLQQLLNKKRWYEKEIIYGARYRASLFPSPTGHKTPQKKRRR